MKLELIFLILAKNLDLQNKNKLKTKLKKKWAQLKKLIIILKSINKIILKKL